MDIYKVHITYKDEKTVTITIKEDDIQKFFDNINAGAFYRNEDSKMGFWTTMSDIRHIIVLPRKDEEPKPEEQEVDGQ